MEDTERQCLKEKQLLTGRHGKRAQKRESC